MERREKTFVLYSAVLVCFWICVDGSLAPKIIDPEVTALWDINLAFHQPAVMKDWEPFVVDPCDWRLITCSDNLVTKLDSPDQNLSGKLPPSIGNLTNLQTLVLRNNSIDGQIPSEIGRLAKLQELDFSYNSFSGEIPTEMSKMKSLQILRLSNNNLNGTIPSFFTHMTVLTFVDLSFNNLNGPVPNLPNKTFNIVGNPLICGNGHKKDCSVTRSTPSPLVLNIPLSSQPFKRPKGHKSLIAIGSSLGGLFLLIAGFIFFLWWRRQHNQQIFLDMNEQQHEEIHLGNLKKFHFKELQIATNNFNSRNLIGKGGSGNVYKGYLRDGTIVAVKRLINCDAFGGENQFETEVQMISLAVHRNLLRLQGFCVTATERLLVYPYMSNGSVASRLKAKPTLNWVTRKIIALGAARGLLYLHEQCDPKIIHRDVKAANILLDEYYEAVVGDFGLAKLLDRHDSHVTTAVRGTAGHIAPEYLSTGQSSEKTDVFSFGILLLELISGRRALEFGKAAHQRGALLDWARKIQQDKKPEMLVDKDLHNNYDPKELEEMVQVALLCTQYLPDQRPKMSEVVLMLEGNFLTEKWEASQEAEISRGGGSEFSYSARYSTDNSSLLVEAMELSGPR